MFWRVVFFIEINGVCGFKPDQHTHTHTCIILTVNKLRAKQTRHSESNHQAAVADGGTNITDVTGRHRSPPVGIDRRVEQRSAHVLLHAGVQGTQGRQSERLGLENELLDTRCEGVSCAL